MIDPKGKPEAATGVPAARDLTDIDGIRAMFYSFPEKTPDIIYIGLNDRDERYHDLYRLHLSTGERELIFENTEGYAGYDFDLDGNLRLLSKVDRRRRHRVLPHRRRQDHLDHQIDQR